MGRIRSIKPEFFTNEMLSTLHSETHLLAAGLLCYADDEGYFNANPKLIQAAIFPIREISVSLPEMLRSLIGIEYIEVFKGKDGREYGKLVHFTEHQRVSHALSSKIKPLRDISGTSPEVSDTPPESFRPELKGNGIEGEVEGEQIPERPSVKDEFHELQYAARLMEEIGMPDTRSNKLAVAASIKSEVKANGKSMAAACDYVLAKVLDLKECGVAIDKFTFEDKKWQVSSAPKGNRQMDEFMRKHGAAE